MLRIQLAQSPLEIQQIRDLFWTYAELRGFDAALGDFQAELDDLPGKYAAPKGCLLLATKEDQAVGCLAYQRLSNDICEMKRMFVLPAYRAQGIGTRLIQRLLAEAQSAGYQRMRLDTHPHMQNAVRLYESFGFYPITRYNQNPTPGIRFFEKRLSEDELSAG
ncbi:MAG: GNAT family N-acetyltransferase [Bacteroidota bacterium]